MLQRYTLKVFFLKIMAGTIFKSLLDNVSIHVFYVLIIQKEGL